MARFFCLLLLTAILSPASALHNQLAGHASPYLAMHGEDPVAWQDWNADAVALAREQDKLLFISSGYFSCHWCHVMQRESYRNSEIAALLNDHFIPVKLDRELHGALDAHLIDFVEQTQGQAGWPLNVFLTPEGYPLIGATYLPPERFSELLKRLDATWKKEPGRMRNLARRTLLKLSMQDTESLDEPLSADALRQALLEQAFTIADMLEGGFGNQNKFPMVPQLMVLLEQQASHPDPRLAEFLTLTLDKMANEGLRDHLAGGFFRYTVDPSWQVPHFEKMLYTQAMLGELYLRAADVFERDDYAELALQTLRFAIREMQNEQGGFVASFSAVDGEGVEGGVYLWHVDTLQQVLGKDDAALAQRYWRMSGHAAFDDGHLPRRGESAADIAAELNLPVDSVEARIDKIRSTLLAARHQRDLPIDDKVLAGWNGLMLAALAQAAARTHDPLFEQAAQRVNDYLRERLWDGQRLLRAADNGRELGRASFEDYAYVAYGLSWYARTRQDKTAASLADQLLQSAWERFHGPAGWRLDDQPLIPGMGDEAAVTEGALPSPSATWINIAARSGEADIRGQGAQSALLARNKVQAEPFWYAGHVQALLQVPRQSRTEKAVKKSDE
ncbi:thioredoxin domain-containing protein [Thiosocius teredinicola]|uniref:thioredoxin domain-containing protein n=1 Tax=Thiosocius teredinicola TaxID=1973002 RepID=UPI000F7AF8E1